MKMLLLVACMIATVVLTGCNEESCDGRVQVQDKVKSDNLGGNIITRPFVAAGSGMLGHGIEITDVKQTRNEAGLLEVSVIGFNKAYNPNRFEYYAEWLDESGAVIESATDNWMPFSVNARSNFSFKVVSKSPNAVDFRINTRKNRKVK